MHQQQGKENLELLSSQDAFNDWMFEEIAPFVKGSVLEVGSGIGNFSQKLLDLKKGRVIVSDFDGHYLDLLKKKFSANNRVSVAKLDLNNSADFKRIGENKVDSIVCLNVLEHVRDDLAALNNMKNVVSKGGRVIILVPAHKWLFNSIDEAIFHKRRYTKKELQALGHQSGMKLVRLHYFNFFSIFGWILSGHILRKKGPSKKGLSALNFLVPAIKSFEKIVLRRKLGLSLIAVYEKQ